MRQQIVDPAGRGRRRSADREPGVDRLHRRRGHVVQVQPLGLRAGPEHLQVGLVPDLEVPGRAPRRGRTGRRGAAPAARTRSPHRSYDFGGEMIAPYAKTVFDGSTGQVARHEAELDHRPQPDREQLVVDRVDDGEVVRRFAVDLGVDPGVVVEDRVRPDRPDADLVVHPPQRLLEFGADLPAAAAVGAEQLAEPLAADHRRPRPVPARCPRQPRRQSPTPPEPCRRQPTARRRRRHSHARRRSPRARSRRHTGTACPGCTVVSTYGGAGTDRTSPLWWSTGSSGPWSPVPRRIR